MMSSARRHQVILEVEDLLQEESWLVDGMDMRPLARYILWSEFEYTNGTQRSLRELILRSRLGPMVTESRSRLAMFGSAPVPKYREVSSELPGTLSDVRPDMGTPFGLFASSRTLMHTSPRLGVVNRSYSSFGRRLTHQTMGIEIESIPLQTTQFGSKAKRELRKLSRAFRSHTRSSDLARFYSGDLASIFHQYGRVVLASRGWSRTLLDRCRHLSYLAHSGWYSPAAMGLTAAFSERGMLVVDVQHGQQGPHQSMFVDWSIRWRPQEALIPHEFWVWGKQTQERISPRDSPDAPLSRVVGYPFLRDMVDWVLSNALSTPIPANQDDGPRVVVALQGGHIDLGGVIPDELKKFILREKARFVLRQHPNSQLSEQERQSLRHEFPEGLEFDDGRSPLPVVLAGADALISGFSSAVLEAAHMQIPSLVWAPVASDQYSELIDSRVVTADPSQTVSLKEVIRRGQQADWTVLENFISSSDEDLQSALGILEDAATTHANDRRSDPS